MTQETSKIIKLSILYILYRVDYPISNTQIINYMLENDYSDFFSIEALIGELKDDDFVSAETVRNRTFFKLTPMGRDSLLALLPDLSMNIRDDIDNYIRANRMKMREEVDVRGNYVASSLGTYNVNLYIDEAGERIFEINLVAPDEEKASKMCATWQRKSAEIYPLIFDKLLS